MGKLQAALDWAARGFPVFPLVPNGKEPAFEGEAWYETATTDPDAIRSMWTDPVLKTERDFNIGVDCTNYVVVDVDVKAGKDGHNQYMQLGGSYETLVVQTPTGGYHCYFEGPDSANAPIAKDVDIRSHHGYVVAPGSTIDGKAYQVVTDMDPQWIPFTVERLLRAPYERRGTATESIDSEASVAAAIRYLETAPVAIEGQRGDETTFVTAARLVREMALSVETAFALLRDYWNERCSPPWQLDDLLQKVENAAQYGTADLGRLDPSVLFSGVSVPVPPTVFEQTGAVWGNALDPVSIPPRPWMIDKLLMLHEQTLIIAPGSAGKSSVSLAIVAHLALGKDFGPYKTHCRCKSIVYNGEDSVAEQSRRLYAVCQTYGMDYNEVKKNVMLLSADEIDMKLVGSQGRTAIVNEAMVQQLVSFASDPDVGLLVYDPLVDIHEVDEGDNPQMNTVMRVMKRIAKQANVASMILHHTTKAGSSRQEDRVGNMDIARGASGIVYKVRIAFTLLNASQEDAEEYGMQDGERGAWVRLDDAKMQYVLASDKPMWFHKEGVKIPSGDVVGVLRYSPLEKNTNNLRLRVAETLISILSANGSASMPMIQAVAAIKTHEPLWANKTDTQIRQRLEGMFGSAVELRGQRLQVIRDNEGSKSNVLIVLS